jgi:hypothetical protein
VEEWGILRLRRGVAQVMDAILGKRAQKKSRSRAKSG